jgi:hypothetical protein
MDVRRCKRKCVRRMTFQAAKPLNLSNCSRPLEAPKCGRTWGGRAQYQWEWAGWPNPASPFAPKCWVSCLNPVYQLYELDQPFDTLRANCWFAAIRLRTQPACGDPGEPLPDVFSHPNRLHRTRENRCECALRFNAETEFFEIRFELRRVGINRNSNRMDRRFFRLCFERAD